MKVQVTAEMAGKLNDLAAASGGDDVESGRMKAIDSEEAFWRLPQKSERRCCL